MRGIVASGHPLTSTAAASVLEDGGNAFDAAIAGLMAACVCEPLLASLSGGGFLIGETAEGRARVYDFFAHTPRKRREDAQMYPIHGDFGGARQEFHIGMGTVAVPGMIKGLVDVHSALGTLPMSRLAEPAIGLARDGVSVNPFQAGIAAILEPIVRATPETEALYTRGDRLIADGDVQRLPELAAVLDLLAAEGDAPFYTGAIADALVQRCAEQGGQLDHTDLAGYRTERRDPLTVGYRRHRIRTNPIPSSGGTLIAHSLRLLDGLRSGRWREDPRGYHRLLPRVMAATHIERLRSGLQVHPNAATVEHLFDDHTINDLVDLLEKHRPAWRGTTHISVVDAERNIAATTVSNGEGCGHLLPGTGIHLNNFLGEEDLAPEGIGHWQSDCRLSSMMSPTLVTRADGTRMALGSGGSNRIRTAITQVLIQLLEMECGLERAVSAPRMHLEENILHLEPGYDSRVIEALSREFPGLQCWDASSVFFGGVHVVSISPDGELDAWADSRRGGSVVSV